jgi:hypothetical protein
LQPGKACSKPASQPASQRRAQQQLNKRASGKQAPQGRLNSGSKLVFMPVRHMHTSARGMPEACRCCCCTRLSCHGGRTVHQLPNIAAHAVEGARGDAAGVRHLRSTGQDSGRQGSSREAEPKEWGVSAAALFSACHASCLTLFPAEACPTPARIGRVQAQAPPSASTPSTHLHEKHKAVVIMGLVGLAVDHLVQACGTRQYGTGGVWVGG